MHEKNSILKSFVLDLVENWDSENSKVHKIPHIFLEQTNIMQK